LIFPIFSRILRKFDRKGKIKKKVEGYIR